MGLHLSENVEMYLETIYLLVEKGGRARTGAIASGWEVSPSSATEMIQRLASLGYVRHEPYRGVELTERGWKAAESIVRKHRLLEVFLTREVGLEGSQATKYACEMEHTLPDEVEAWVCGLLGHPTTAPTGEPIPPGACCDAPRAAHRPGGEAKPAGEKKGQRREGTPPVG